MANIDEKRQEGRRTGDRRGNDRRGTDRRGDSTTQVIKFLIGTLVVLLGTLFYIFTIGL